MKKIYLHIGTPKTGTSSLQHFFLNNRAILEKNGILYPIWTDHQAWGGKNSIDGNLGWIERNKLTEEEKKERINVLLKSYDKILLSTENIWLEVEKRNFLNIIKDISAEIEIVVIVYLRKQIDYLESQYRECVRLILLDESFYKICNFPTKEMDGVKKSLDYYSVLEEMADVIGKKNILVRPYEKGQFKNGNIIEDFLELIGLSLSNEFILPERNYNPSMSNAALEMKRYMNLSSIATQKNMNDCFYDVLMEDGVEEGSEKECVHFKSLLSFSQRQEFMKNYEDINRKIAVDYLNRENGILFYEKDNENLAGASVSTHDLLKQTIRFFTSVILIKNKEIISLQKETEEIKRNNERINQENNKRDEELQLSQQRLQDEITKLAGAVGEIKTKEENLLLQLLEKQQEINNIKNGYCWRITAPLRMIRRLFIRN